MLTCWAFLPPPIATQMNMFGFSIYMFRFSVFWMRKSAAVKLQFHLFIAFIPLNARKFDKMMLQIYGVCTQRKAEKKELPAKVICTKPKIELLFIMYHFFCECVFHILGVKSWLLNTNAGDLTVAYAPCTHNTSDEQLQLLSFIVHPTEPQ